MESSWSCGNNSDKINMKISELIAELEKYKTEVGDVFVETRNPAGDWVAPDYVGKVNISRKQGEVLWRVFIES